MMFEVDYMPVRKNLETNTGISFVHGDVVSSLSELPLFRLEIRRFQTDNHAKAFVDGLEAAGSMNKLVFDWEEGDTNNNRLVILGFLQDEVSEETPLSERISLVDFTPSDRDHAARIRASKRQLDENRQAATERKAEAMEMAEPLVKLGYSVTDFANQHVAVKSPDGNSFSISWGFYRQGIEISSSVYELTLGDIDLAHEFDEALKETPCEFEDTTRSSLMIRNLSDRENLTEAISALLEAERKLMAIRKQAYWNRFVAGTPMNKQRREFLQGAASTGIRCYINRGNQRASAGGRDIGATEINILLRRGWIEGKFPNFEISETGRQDSGRS